MALTPGDPCVQTCPNCGTLVDITEQEPLSKFECPTCGTTMRTSRQYNHFSIIEHLGTGGMGSVYKAMDRNLNRMVALKLLRRELSADETYIAKLEDEARITASINHPFVVKVFSFGVDHGQYYIAMELVDKGTLDDLMQLQNRIAEMQVLQVGLQIASGLQAAHDRGLIHRDVKPGNILFADAHTAKITDFGLALLAEHEADARGEIWGTPYYIAPEKLSQQPEDFRSDIYSLGGTLFHAVAGRPPFEAETASLVALKHLKSKAVSLQAFAPDVSSETSYVINRMLNKDPNQRYASYGDLTDHLRYAIEQLGARTGKTHAGRQRVVVESKGQNQLAGVLTLLLLALMVAGGILAYSFRAKLFGVGTGESAGTAPANVQASGPDNKAASEALYQEARHEIVADKYTDAQAGFTGLAQATEPPPASAQLDPTAPGHGRPAQPPGQRRAHGLCLAPRRRTVLQRRQATGARQLLRGNGSLSRHGSNDPGERHRPVEERHVRGHGAVPLRPEGLGNGGLRGRRRVIQSLPRRQPAGAISLDHGVRAHRPQGHPRLRAVCPVGGAAQGGRGRQGRAPGGFCQGARPTPEQRQAGGSVLRRRGRTEQWQHPGSRGLRIPHLPPRTLRRT